MPDVAVPGAATLKVGEKKVVKAGDLEVLIIRQPNFLMGVQPKCPHAGAPLEEGAICNGRLVCPWHLGTFALPTGDLLEPPPLKGLTTYAVREEGSDLIVNTDPLEHEALGKTTSENARTFLLAGAGAASTMAALTLRREGFAGRILLVDPVADEPVDRTQLSKQALAGKVPLEKTRLSDLDSLGLERIAASLTQLHANSAELSDGQTVNFDRALLATGGIPQRLGIPGAELAFTLRHTADVKAILEKASEGSHAVVVGTSFIGLEAASALTQKGVHVTVLGKEPDLPFAKKFGERVARAMVALHEKNGVTFLLGAETQSIGASAVTIQREGRQQELPADLVVLGVGVEPTLTFTHTLPLAEQGGVATDDTLRVTDSLFVAGDIASVNGTRIEHWRLAEQHGMLAARNMLGFNERYTGAPFFWTFHFGKRLGYLGHASKWDEIVYDGNVEELSFLAFFVKDEKVAAVLSCGRDHDTAALAEPMRQPSTLAELRAHLTSNP